MKKIILFTLLCLPAMSHAQENYGLLDNRKKKEENELHKPMKNANQIIVHSGLAKDSLFDKVVMLLSEKGYAISSKDKGYGIISTEEKGVKADRNVTAKLTVIVKDGLATLKGQFKFNIGLTFGAVRSEPSFEEIKYKGMRGSPYRKAWDELNAVAIWLKGDSIEFAIN